ncbi:MAG: hypothetical protein Q7S92_05125 [Candidatus Diapherotrites archaeon]|nr:hypothetical protein [Candidatus Diapherotrites archaeon]
MAIAEKRLKIGKPKQRTRERRIREYKYRTILLPEKVKTAFEIVNTVGQNLTRKQAIDYLTANFLAFAEGTRQQMRDRWRGLPKFREYAERKLFIDSDINQLQALAASTAGRLFERERKVFSDKYVLPHLKAYLAERKLPISHLAVIDAWNQLVGETKARTATDPLNIREFERIYVESLKFQRIHPLMVNTFNNQIINKAFGSKRLTANQRKAVKRWIQSNLQRWKSQIDEVGKKYFKSFQKPERNMRDVFLDLKQVDVVQMDAAEQDFSAVSERIAQEVRAKFSVEFFKQPRKVLSPLLAAGNGSSKNGTRSLRLAEYVPGEKSTRERERIIQAKQERSALVGRPFDRLRFAFTEIEKENHGDYSFLKKLFSEKKVNEDAIVRLYASGSLTRRIFRTAVEDVKFLDHFSAKELTVLAKGLSYIGSKGRVIQSARRAFQSAQGKEIFAFLERTGLLETHHGGGTVVYLRRPQSEART